LVPVGQIGAVDHVRAENGDRELVGLVLRQLGVALQRKRGRSTFGRWWRVTATLPDRIEVEAKRGLLRT
jgi:hypothetical protein